MTTAVAQPEAQTPKGPPRRAPKPMEAWQKRCLFGYWKELAPKLPFEPDPADADPHRTLRLQYAMRKLGKPVTSWSKLTRGQAGALIAAMRKDLGRDPESGLRDTSKARPDAIAIVLKLAQELYGAEWDRALGARLAQRPFFHHAPVTDVTPRQSHELIEILLDHLERKLFPDGAPMEVRKERKEGLRKHFAVNH